MNSYPIWWDQTVTVYNKFEDPNTKAISWYRTVLPRCFWKYIHEEYGGISDVKTDYTICRIPKNDSFLEKYLWNEESEINKSSHFTLSLGDIIVLGEVEDEIDEYTAGSRATDLISKYKKLQGCIVIETLTINVGDGRVDEHYHIKGI